MERVVVALGGSVIAPAEPDPRRLQRVADALAGWAQEAHLAVVVGGGAPARRAIAIAREAGLDDRELDRVGIEATRLNAQTIASLLLARDVEVPTDLPHTTRDAADFVADGGMVVMGGTVPGHSTDFVAAELAHRLKADRLVVVTNVTGVYDKDPREHPELEHRPELDFEELLLIVGERSWKGPGAAGVIDGPASALIAERGLTTLVVAGDDLQNIGKAVLGRPCRGTRISGTPVVL